ncbi:Dehydrogenases with different specificities (related to short-chain alcohol dehydrogenases) [Ceraceosorus bombacis]|uniref:Dehydrogenases with different specificities (Related to short-chain alcohol dehydrogenases) n=1 Tax=Ceraceosorus bombacis TaxID=401625 RepID=A0A0P1BI25_9BASI|nr:Dehydrogenases with different specificities (related to short-chain alcohol dehydrogenases) [Ceraceosorus bombacis]
MTKHTLIVATGGHSGLGFQTLHQLLQRAPTSLPPPYHLILFGRASSASSTGVDRLSSLCSADTASKLEYRSLDLDDLAATRSAGTLSLDLDDLAATRSAGTLLADEVKAKNWSISTLFFNAAIWPAKRESVKSHDDEGEREVDKCLAVNHIAHLLFLQPLLPLLLERAYTPDNRAPRIVFTNSSLHRRADPSTLESLFDLTKSGPEGWTGRACYSASKFIQILGARKLAERLEEQLTLRGSDAVAPELERHF